MSNTTPRVAAEDASLEVPLASTFVRAVQLVGMSLLAWLLYALISVDRASPTYLVRIAGIAPMVAAFMSVLGFSLIRYGRQKLTLDERGIWLGDAHRKGVEWTKIEGYELPQRGVLRVWGKEGQSLFIPNHFGIDVSERLDPIVQMLDSRVGLDGERPTLSLPSDPLQLRIHHPYGNLPPVQMESGVTYRYVRKERLASEAKTAMLTNIACGITLSIMLILMGKHLPGAWIFIGLGFLIASLNLLTAFNYFKILQSLNDRFVLRDGEIWVLGRKRDFALPPQRKGRRIALLRQLTTAHGAGPFAYRMAPQLLEPDV